MRERDRDIRRRRQRRKKRLKARIRELIGQANSAIQKKPVAVMEEAKAEKRIVHRKPAAKIAKHAKEAAEPHKKGEA